MGHKHVQWTQESYENHRPRSEASKCLCWEEQLQNEKHNYQHALTEKLCRQEESENVEEELSRRKETLEEVVGQTIGEIGYEIN